MDHIAQSEDSDDAPYRRRGRPTGKNRVPLSINERRARNAQYERERRYETSEAMAELAAAAGCDQTLSTSEILASAISQLKRAEELGSSQDIEVLKRCNDKLIQQVAALEQRLSNLEDEQYSQDSDSNHSMDGKTKRKVRKTEKMAKRIKTEAEISMVTIKTEPDDYNGEEL